MAQEPIPNPVNPGWKTYIDIRHTLDDSGQALSYDALMHTYDALKTTRHEIPHMDQLLASLINKRNKNPRVDQMILICAASALGGSKFPVPGADGIFESILAKDDRLTAWVLAFVAAAIGDYVEVMPEGDKLADLIEAKLSIVVSTPGPKKEDFGRHFLPPPKSEYIRSYIANIKTMNLRVSERHHYYALITNGHREADIEKALRQLQSIGIPGKGKRPLALMKHLARNPAQIVN